MSQDNDLTRRVPPKDSPEKDNKSSRRPKKAPQPQHTSVFDRRIRVSSDSSFTVPLVLVLLFPCLVILSILVLFMRTPDSQDVMNMPTGGISSSRYELRHIKRSIQRSDIV